MWLLKKAMDQQRQWFAITEFDDRRKKYNRIVTAHNGPASAGRLYVRNEQVEFIEQFGQYPDVNHDDLLDASSMALMELEGMYVDKEGNVMSMLDDDDDPTKHRPLNIWHAP